MTEEIKAVELEDDTLESVAGGDAENPTGVMYYWTCCKPGSFSPVPDWHDKIPQYCVNVGLI